MRQIFVSPKGDFEVYEERPEGFFTQEEWIKEQRERREKTIASVQQAQATLTQPPEAQRLDRIQQTQNAIVSNKLFLENVGNPDFIAMQRERATVRLKKLESDLECLRQGKEPEGDCGCK